jgi:hypothetical protein
MRIATPSHPEPIHRPARIRGSGLFLDAEEALMARRRWFDMVQSKVMLDALGDEHLEAFFILRGGTAHGWASMTGTEREAVFWRCLIDPEATIPSALASHRRVVSVVHSGATER